ncbi:MAG TPA: hypothetical protein VN667_12610 [Burkholderiales bacterium]|nr:hypothetical protein [Burkholderiales bacterium]
MLAALTIGAVGVSAQTAAPAEQAAAPTSKNLAAGFNSLPKGTKVVVMPVDIELFSLSAGGIPEPKADWTETASRFFKSALLKEEKALGLVTVELSETDADALDEINNLHGAVARAIAIHHFGNLGLPTKEGKLDWSLGEAVRPIKEKTGADYALFNWVRDSYASAERKAAMVVLALAGVALTGGVQVGYSSLVDLNTGRVLWFSRLARGRGDLREEQPAQETVKALLDHFPVVQ